MENINRRTFFGAAAMGAVAAMAPVVARADESKDAAADAAKKISSGELVVANMTASSNAAAKN